MYECMLLGFKEGVGKQSGKAYYQIFLVSDCTPQDNDYGRVGLKEVDYFVTKNVYDQLSFDMIGKMVRIETSGFGKFATVTGVKVAK